MWIFDPRRNRMIPATPAGVRRILNDRKVHAIVHNMGIPKKSSKAWTNPLDWDQDEEKMAKKWRSMYAKNGKRRPHSLARAARKHLQQLRQVNEF